MGHRFTQIFIKDNSEFEVAKPTKLAKLAQLAKQIKLIVKLFCGSGFPAAT